MRTAASLLLPSNPKNMKEELEKLIEDRIQELSDDLRNSYIPKEYREEKEKKIEVLKALIDALFYN